MRTRCCRADPGRPLSVEGLDRAKALNLAAASQALMADGQANIPGQSSGMSPVQRRQLDTMTDALPGLLNSLKAEETLNDIRFDSGHATTGSISVLRLDIAGSAVNKRFDARMNIAMDGLALAFIPADAMAYLPRHVDMVSVVSGMPTGAMIDLLRTAIANNADPGALQPRFNALFSDPAARVGIESLSFDSGPMRMTGSARIMAQADGQPSAQIHLSATGMDALITQAQSTPLLQQALPIMFIAKGIGRQEGGAVVWDISLGNGPITVNGIPFGQTPAPRR